ncbi:MAG: hypothetical protein KF812_04580 [Fimbriimonadaceae bacterium]|nr:hypothetical protein [Fimbriimonadaceae bacterium]
MSELKNKGTAVPFFILFVVLAAVVGYGMANPAPEHHAAESHGDASHDESGHDTGTDHGTTNEHSDEDSHSDAPAMDISHAPGDVYDSAGHLEGTATAPVEPTMSNETNAPKPGVEAHTNSEDDASTSSSSESESHNASESH